MYDGIFNCITIYSYAIFTLWEQMFQATEEGKLPEDCFDFTDWILGPRWRCPFQLASLSWHQTCSWGMGSRQAGQRPRVWAGPVGSACGHHQRCGLKWIYSMTGRKRKRAQSAKPALTGTERTSALLRERHKRPFCLCHIYNYGMPYLEGR